MTEPVNTPPEPATLASVPAETPKKRKLPSRQTVIKYTKYALMGIGAVTIAKKGSELLNKEVSVDFNAEVKDPEESTDND